MTIGNNKFQSVINFGSSGNSNIGTWSDDIQHTGGGAGGGSNTGGGSNSSNTSSTTGSFNGLGNVTGDVVGFFDPNTMFEGNDNSNSDENSESDGSSAGLTNNLFVDNTTKNTSQGSSNSSTQILEKINSELNYIMNSLKIQQDKEVINKTQISSPQIVSVGSKLCSDIGFFDVYGRRHNNNIFKINNTYYGVTYSLYKTDKTFNNFSTENEIFSDTEVKLSLEKLQRNIQKATKYTYVFEDKINNKITYNEYGGEITHLGNNIYIGVNIPEQNNLIHENVTCYYTDKFGVFNNVAEINNNVYVLSDGKIYQLEEIKGNREVISLLKFSYDFNTSTNELIISSYTSNEKIVFTAQTLPLKNGINKQYYVGSYDFLGKNDETCYSIFTITYTNTINNLTFNPSLDSFNKLSSSSGVLLNIDTYMLNGNQIFDLIGSKNMYFDNFSINTGNSYAYEYIKYNQSYYKKSPNVCTTVTPLQFNQNKIINSGKYTYQLTYIKNVYSFKDNIESLNYKTKQLILNTEVSITYTYFDVLSNSYVNYNSESIFFINNEYYGLNIIDKPIIVNEQPIEENEETTKETNNTPILDYASNFVFNLIEVFERSYFNEEYFSENTKKKILTHNSQDYFTTYKAIPFVLKNDVTLLESSDYLFNPPIYGDIIFNSTHEGNGYTYNLISYESTILKDSFWYKKYKEEVLPLLINSYSYNVSPLEISSANIIPGNKEKVLNKIYKPEITYYDYVNSYNERYEFMYIDERNIQHIYEDKVIFNNNTYYGIRDVEYSYTYSYTIDDQSYSYIGTASYISNELIPLIRNLRVETEPVLQKLTYRESSYVNQSVIMDSSFRLLNGCKVNITNQRFIPTAYKDIISINPNTHEPEIQQVIEHESYIAYEYSVDEVPFITNTYIYHQNGLTINNIDELKKSTQNLTYLSLLNDLPNILDSSNNELNDSLKLMSRGISSKLSDLIQYLKTSNDVSDKNLLAGFHLNNDTAKANNIELVSSLSSLNTGIDNSLTYLVNKYEDLESKNILSNKVNTSNIIQSNKKHLDRVSDSITYSGDQVNSALSYISYILCLSNNVSKLSENTNISLIGKQVFEEVVTLSYIAEPIKGSKLTNKVPKYTYSYSYVNKYYATPESAEISSYIDISNANDLEALIGFHKINDSYQYMVDDNIYEVSKTKYLGIADILYDIYLNLKVQSKQSFIMDVTKGIFVNNNVIDRLAYTSPNELAKKSVYLANALWEELENSNVLCE